MIKKILHFLNKEIGGLHEAAYLLGFFAILSQLLALVRDRLLAHSFGAGGTLDMYYAAFRIPDFIFITVGSMVSISVLIPFLINKMKEGVHEGREFISTIFSFFFLLIVAACLIAFALVPWLLPRLFPGFTGENLTQLISLTRVLLLSPILLGLSNILGTMTQAYKRFFIYALSPILYNLGIIAGVVFLYPRFGLIGLGYGVIAGAFMHVFIQIPFIVGHGLLPRFSLKFNFKEIRRVLFVSVPRTFTLGSDNISMVFLVSFASLMTAGSIAVFNFSYNLQSVPLSVIGASYSLAAFPILIALYANGEKSKFVERIVASARHIIFWSVPVIVLFIVLRAQIVRTILGSGRFNWDDTRLTAAALAIFAASVVFQNLTLLFVRAYYAAGNTLKPFVAKLINALTTVILGYGFMIWFQHSESFRYFMETILHVRGITGTIVLTLPLGWSVGELLNTLALWIIFSRDFKNFSKPILKPLGQVVVSSAVLGVVSYLSLDVFDDVFSLNTTIGVFMQGLISGIIGIIAAVIVLVLLKNEEIKDFWETMKRRVWKVKVVPPSQPGL